MTTEQKIKEAFESWYGTLDQWDKVDYDIALVNFKERYKACLEDFKKESEWCEVVDLDSAIDKAMESV